MIDALMSEPSTLLRTLVVDDEKLARSGLRAMLATDAQLAIEECAGGRDAVRRILDAVNDPFDIVFLDVRMPGMNGFDVIAEVGADRMPVVVFTTAHAEHAIQAFDAFALDYLLKPVREARLAQAVSRAKEAVRHRRSADLNKQPVAQRTLRPSSTVNVHTAERGGDAHSLPLRRILLRSGAASYYIDAGDIDWIEADAYYARIWTGVRSHLLRQSLSQLESMLDPRQFVRIHRSAIVNVRRVRDMVRIGLAKYCVRMHDGRPIPMSRDRRRALHAALRAVDG
jgi:two-component system, LytTR family, response regulator